ncbi:hypothetical protein [Amycolatopsis nalaikhensis]|uniref:Minor tail protein n=1 Tax=Amycolatopsis nalaikhensis TaxID=715472 RepID=A0ABY8XTP6_9PSEU|nr:hypothetical protein [Amycolatopsis sp. 2-2]WIV59059.1 hypothetical protein QP939_10705 [Amycolatopsis sp. 2-2]
MVADLRSGRVLDELPLTGVKYNKPLNDSGKFSGTWDLTRHPSSTRRDPYELTMPARRALYVMRDDRPMWGGLIWTRKYDSGSHKVEVAGADWWSYFDHRKVLPILPAAPLPLDHVAGLKMAANDVEQNDIARALVQLAQTHAGGDIGIEFDDSQSFIYRDRTYTGHELTSVGEALRQLAAVINGPDIMFGVAPGTGGRIRRLMRVGTPRLGQAGTAHVWETGGNIVNYTWPSDATRMATRTFASGDGMAEGTPIAVAEDVDKYTQHWPLLESEQGYTSVSDADTLQGHADADQLVARLPVALPTLTVRGNTAPYVGEWDTGDDVRVVIRDEFIRRGLDTPMRIVDAQYAPSEAAETVTITMSPLIEDAA